MTDVPKLEMSHVGIFVTDPDRLKGFYTRVLGLQITDDGLFDGVRLVFMSGSPRDHHQVVLVEGRSPDAPTTVNQLSFRCAGLAEMKRVHALLTDDADVDRMETVDHGNAWSIYFWDPEGNRLEVFMDTPWYIDQPHRIEMDLTLSDEEIYRRSEEHVRADASFRTVEDWRAATFKELAPAE